MALKDAISTVLNRNAFYRDGYRLMLRISVIQLSVVMLLIATIIGLVLTIETKHIYFATTSDGRIIPIIPLTDAYRSDAEVVTWAAETSKSVMTFDYANYRPHLQQSSYSFTEKGWDSFNKALKDSNMIEAVKERKLVVSLDIVSAPEIINAVVKDGRFTWDLRFPVTIKLEGAEAPQPTKAILLLRIVRVSTLQNPDGIQIEQWLMKERSAAELK